VDEVRYNDKAPWPPATDGSGPSLQRRDPQAYGDDPINWTAAAPTPGAQNSLPDFDGDGMPDEWEIANGTDPLTADATADPDGDGFVNRDEYRAGTDPHDGTSYLKLNVRWENGHVSLSFVAKAGRPYRVLFRDTLEPGTWSVRREFAPGSERVESVVDEPSPERTRFYRLLIP
jgi:hypothetical protein